MPLTTRRPLSGQKMPQLPRFGGEAPEKPAVKQSEPSRKQEAPVKITYAHGSQFADFLGKAAETLTHLAKPAKGKTPQPPQSKIPEANPPASKPPVPEPTPTPAKPVAAVAEVAPTEIAPTVQVVEKTAAVLASPASEAPSVAPAKSPESAPAAAAPVKLPEPAPAVVAPAKVPEPAKALPEKVLKNPLDAWLPPRETFEAKLKKQQPSQKTVGSRLKAVAKLGVSFPLALVMLGRKVVTGAAYPDVSWWPKSLGRYFGNTNGLLDDMIQSARRPKGAADRYEHYNPQNTKPGKQMLAGNVKEAFQCVLIGLNKNPYSFEANMGAGILCADLLSDLNGVKLANGRNWFNLAEDKLKAVGESGIPFAEIGIEAFRRAALVRYPQGEPADMPKPYFYMCPYTGMADIYELTGQGEKALTFRKKAIEQSRAAETKENPSYGLTRLMYAAVDTCKKFGYGEEALRLFKETLLQDAVLNDTYRNSVAKVVVESRLAANPETDPATVDKPALQREILLNLLRELHEAHPDRPHLKKFFKDFLQSKVTTDQYPQRDEWLAKLKN